ncbi:RCC1 domain-containing protein [Sphaerimonospora mesophila]|uniref:RCC1 domain-containing protein n=1 Tax=Sphaerimonospora mesophila TaxID=37483 RepID=UPI0006E13A92
MSTHGAIGAGAHLVQEKLCDQTVDASGEVVSSVSFLRRYLVDRDGQQTTTAVDYQLDGRTPYTPVGTIIADCSTSAPSPAPDPCAGVPAGALEPEWTPVYDPPASETTVRRTTPLTVTFGQPVSPVDTLVAVGGQPASLSHVAGATYRVVVAEPLSPCETVTATVWPVAVNGCADPAGSYTSDPYTTRAEAAPAYAWGYGAWGRVGDGASTNRLTPVPQATGDTQLVTIGGGAEALSLAIDTEGRVWAWGYNGSGGFGDGTTNWSSTPVPSTMPPGVTAIAVDAMQYTGAFLGSDGQVYTTGEGGLGQLGTGGTSDRTTWAAVTLPASVTQIACGLDHMIVLTEDGEVWGWGYDGYGQASGTTTSSNKLTPVQTPFPAGTVITSIAAGRYHNVAVDDGGQVWTWGIDNWQQLGDCNPDTATQQVPSQIPMPPGVTAATALAGFPSGGFVTPSGDMWVWGSDVFGNTGQGTSGGTTPCAVQVPLPGPVADADIGYDSMIAMLEDGRIYTWGYGGSGQMGNGGAAATNPTPVQVTALPAGPPTGVSMCDYTCYVTYEPDPC